jgi:hypothetical protein
MIQTDNAMREAFNKASAEVPTKKRTAAYAMVKSALHRKVGVTNRKNLWSVERNGK